jgi:hypothetical protein
MQTARAEVRYGASSETQSARHLKSMRSKDKSSMLSTDILQSYRMLGSLPHTPPHSHTLTRAALDGVHTLDPTWKSVKRTPSAANWSKWGVNPFVGGQLAPRSPKPLGDRIQVRGTS